MVYGLLTDANVELGKYKDAETSAQWMLNLRGANVPSLTRAAYLRELFGDTEGPWNSWRWRFSRQPRGIEDAHDHHADCPREARFRQAAAAEALLQQALTAFPGLSLCAGKSS